MTDVWAKRRRRDVDGLSDGGEQAVERADGRAGERASGQSAVVARRSNANNARHRSFRRPPLSTLAANHNDDDNATLQKRPQI